MVYISRALHDLTLIPFSFSNKFLNSYYDVNNTSVDSIRPNNFSIVHDSFVGSRSASSDLLIAVLIGRSKFAVQLVEFFKRIRTSIGSLAASQLIVQKLVEVANERR